jgi:DNA polymerase III alpha subunit
MVGVCAYSKHRSGPKGRFAYLTLSDPVGIYETSIFNEELITNSRDLMEAGNPLVLVCLARKDEGGTRLLVKEIIKLHDFIQNTKAKKEEYQDIKAQPKRDKNFDWKNKNNNDSRDDYIALQAQRHKKIEELKKKIFLDQVVINIDERDAIFSVKSFLSQKIAPEEIQKVTKVFIVTGGSKIELPGSYVIEKIDSDKLGLIDGISVSSS